MKLIRHETREKKSEQRHNFNNMYVREIPAEHMPEVREIMERNRAAMLIPFSDLERLFYFYYRFIKVLQRGENVDKRIKKDLSCPACKGKVIMYCRNLDL